MLQRELSLKAVVKGSLVSSLFQLECIYPERRKKETDIYLARVSFCGVSSVMMHVPKNLVYCE